MLDLLHQLPVGEGQGKGQILQLKIIVFGALHFLVVLGVEEAGLSDHGKIKGAAGVIADDDIGGYQKLLHILIGTGVQNAVRVGQRVILVADVGMHPHQDGPGAAEALLKGSQKLVVIQVGHIGLAAVTVGGGVERQLRTLGQAKMLMYLSDIGSRILKINIIFRNTLFQNRPVVPEGLPVGFAFPAAAGQKKIHILGINFRIGHIFFGKGVLAVLFHFFQA